MGKGSSSGYSSWSGFLWGCAVGSVTIYVYQNWDSIRTLVHEILGDDDDEEERKDTFDEGTDKSATRGIRAVANSTAAKTLNDNEQHGFLSDILQQLWPYINIAGSDTIRDTAEPMFQELMPGPLKTLHFTKIDLGSVPIRLDNVTIHAVDLESNSLQFDMDVVWDGNCDIKLKADYMGSFGVKSVKMRGRLSILMRPLLPTTSIVGGIQYGFINPPDLSLKYSGLAHLADFKVIDQTITQIMQSTMSGMMVLSRRRLYKMDKGCDFSKIYQPPLGVARVKVISGRGFVIEKGILVDDIPDCYCKLSLGDMKHRTTTVMDNLEPEWNETFDFLLSDYDQIVELQCWDEDDGPLDPDDDLGRAATTPGEIILSGNKLELALQQGDRPNGAYVTLGCEVLNFTSDLTSLSNTSPNHLCGLCTILISRAYDIPLPKEEAATFVQVTCGTHKFTTSAVVDYPGVDCLNPWYDKAFLVDLTPAMIEGANVPSVHLELINGTDTVLGSIVLTHKDMVDPEDHTLAETRPIGTKGAKLQYRVSVQGVQPKITPPVFPTSEESSSFDMLSDEVAKDLEMAGGTPPRLRGSALSSPLDAVVNQPRDLGDQSSFSSALQRIDSATRLNDETRPASEEHNLVRVTVVSGNGFKVRKTPWWQPDDTPDVYLNVTFGSSPAVWRTRTIYDNLFPVWNESRDFILHSHGQVINVEVYDEEGKNKEDDVHYGSFRVTVGKVLLQGGTMQQEILKEGQNTGAYITVSCQLVKS